MENKCCKKCFVKMEGLSADVCLNSSCFCHSTPGPKEEMREISFTPRNYGRLSNQLLEFYGRCKLGESIIFSMPEGSIYSQKALDTALKDQAERIIGEIPDFLDRNVDYGYDAQYLKQQLRDKFIK